MEIIRSEIMSSYTQQNMVYTLVWFSQQKNNRNSIMSRCSVQYPTDTKIEIIFVKIFKYLFNLFDLNECWITVIVVRVWVLNCLRLNSNLNNIKCFHLRKKILLDLCVGQRASREICAAVFHCAHEKNPWIVLHWWSLGLATQLCYLA